ncbi:MAG: hypothetical protein K8T25_08565 [Planctomycetia bacterium]|nr:hypothetical protein [Planctomycetia bacterium]
MAPAAHDDLDLTALTSSLFGGDVIASFAAVKALLVVNTTTTPGDDLALGGAGSGGHAWAAPFADDQGSVLAVAADSMILLVNKLAGWPVTNGSADVLRLTNSGSGNVTARIVIVGTSA